MDRCSECGDLYVFIVRGQREELAVDFERHSRLIRCRMCLSLYEYDVEDRQEAERISVEEARKRFPGAL